MKTRTSHTYSLRRKKKINYSNYHFVLALYTIYKKESKKEARLPVHDFRNRVFQKQLDTATLKQKLWRYILAITKALTGNVFNRKEKPQLLIGGLRNTPEKYDVQ
jgi:hypothetical protein